MKPSTHIQVVGAPCKQWRKKKCASGCSMHTHSGTHMHLLQSIFISPPCGHSCDYTEELSAWTSIDSLWPPSLLHWPHSATVRSLRHLQWSGEDRGWERWRRHERRGRRGHVGGHRRWSKIKSFEQKLRLYKLREKNMGKLWHSFSSKPRPFLNPYKNSYSQK